MQIKIFSVLLLIVILVVGCSNDTHNIKEENDSQHINITNKTKLYKPLPNTSWHLQFTGNINTEYHVNVYDIDLVETPQSVIDKLHKKNIKVICYFSAGTLEEFRDDKDNFPKSVIGNTLNDYPNERWLDISNYELFSSIMQKRMDLAVKKKCDGVDPDNIDGYLNDNGFNFTYDNQLKYNIWLSKEAHKRKLSIGLKNDLEQIKDLVNYFDFAVNEQCFEYEECELLEPFINQNKAVFGVEYELNKEDFCNKANNMQFSWLKMDYDLDGKRISCED